MNSNDKANELEKYLSRSMSILKSLFFLHTAILVLAGVALVINATSNLTVEPKTVINSGIFGLVGSIIYFSRKCYVYLITDKFRKILEENKETYIKYPSSFMSVLMGYYLYLSMRPLVGLFIGPIFYMLAYTGLLTFVKVSATEADLSQSGRYFIYVVAFLGGLASSDILDYLSKLAKKIVVKGT